MLARVATFENRDVTRADELVELVRSRAVTGDVVPELVRHVMLLDPRDRSALEVTFFDSEDGLLAAEPALESLGAEIPETVRGRRTSVSVYEVALDDVNGATGRRASPRSRSRRTGSPTRSTRSASRHTSRRTSSKAGRASSHSSTARPGSRRRSRSGRATMRSVAARSARRSSAAASSPPAAARSRACTPTTLHSTTCPSPSDTTFRVNPSQVQVLAP